MHHPKMAGWDRRRCGNALGALQAQLGADSSPSAAWCDRQAGDTSSPQECEKRKLWALSPPRRGRPKGKQVVGLGK